MTAPSDPNNNGTNIPDPNAPVDPGMNINTGMDTGAPVPPDPQAERINRLAGEPAPDISPDEFARLQKMGEIHLDDQGRIRPRRREDNDPGVSLRKRRAWYVG